jgi:hypothetical protein
MKPQPTQWSQYIAPQYSQQRLLCRLLARPRPHRRRRRMPRTPHLSSSSWSATLPGAGPAVSVASPLGQDALQQPPTFLFVGEHLGSIAASAFLLSVHASAICERHHTTDNLRCPCVPPTADRQWKYTCSKHVHIAKPAAMAPYSAGLWRWRHGCLRHRGRPHRAPGVRMGNEREAPNLQ